MKLDEDFNKMKKREKSLNIIRIITLSLLPISIFISCFSIYGTIGIIISFLSFSVVMSLIFGNKASFKEKIIPGLLDDSLSFTVLDNQMNAVVLKSEIIQGKISLKILTNDIISGYYNDIRFRSFDCIVSKRNYPFMKYLKDDIPTLFKGRFYQIKNKANIKNKVLFIHGDNNNLAKITVDHEIDKTFNIYAKDENIGFISKEFFDDLERINKIVDGKMSLSLINGSIFVAINNNIDSFELENLDSISEVSNAYKHDLMIVEEINKAIKRIEVMTNESEV